MKFQGALVKEQGLTFAIVIVKPYVLNRAGERERLRRSFAPVFGGVPTVLMAQDSRGIPTYHGRHDIVDFLASVPMESIPWQEYTLS